MSMKLGSCPIEEIDKSSSSDGDAEHWVLCDGCHKWRRVTGVYAAQLDDDTPWYCGQNPDKKYASCDIPQEMTNEQIDEEDSEIDLEKDAKPLARLPVVWQLLKSNIFSHRKRKFQREDDIMICHCAPVWRGGDGCGPDCINRLLNIECVAGFCPCEEKCSNQMFSQRRYAKLEVKRAGPKGFGLFAAQDIKSGQFIIEYIGEVLDEDEYMRRKDHYISVGQRHYYFMNVGNGEVIDAARKGNHARFINHSCEPNCETQKWVVQGELAIGLFALRDIPCGEELTFDYNFERYGDKPMRCYCNTRSCRKFIGGSQEVLGEDRIGEAYDVSNDMEPMMVTEAEVDFMVEAILNRSIGIMSDVPTHSMLRTLRHMCQQRGITWSPAYVESPIKSPPKPERPMLPPIKLILPKAVDSKQSLSQPSTTDASIPVSIPQRVLQPRVTDVNGPRTSSQAHGRDADVSLRVSQPRTTDINMPQNASQPAQPPTTNIGTSQKVSQPRSADGIVANGPQATVADVSLMQQKGSAAAGAAPVQSALRKLQLASARQTAAGQAAQPELKLKLNVVLVKQEPPGSSALQEAPAHKDTSTPQESPTLKATSSPQELPTPQHASTPQDLPASKDYSTPPELSAPKDLFTPQDLPRPTDSIPRELPTPRAFSTPREPLTPKLPPAVLEPVRPMAVSAPPAFRGPLKAAFKQMKQLRQQSLHIPQPVLDPAPAAAPLPTHQPADESRAPQVQPETVRHDTCNNAKLPGVSAAPAEAAETTGDLMLYDRRAVDVRETGHDATAPAALSTQPDTADEAMVQDVRLVDTPAPLQSTEVECVVEPLQPDANGADIVAAQAQVNATADSMQCDASVSDVSAPSHAQVDATAGAMHCDASAMDVSAPETQLDGTHEAMEQGPSISVDGTDDPMQHDISAPDASAQDTDGRVVELEDSNVHHTANGCHHDHDHDLSDATAMEAAAFVDRQQPATDDNHDAALWDSPSRRVRPQKRMVIMDEEDMDDSPRHHPNTAQHIPGSTPHQQDMEQLDQNAPETAPYQEPTDIAVAQPTLKVEEPDSADISHVQTIQAVPFETDFDLLSPAKPRRRLVKKVSNAAKLKKQEAEQLAKAELARVNAELAKVSSMGGDDAGVDGNGSVLENAAGVSYKRPAATASSIASASTMVAPALSNSGFSTSVSTLPRRAVPSASSPPHYSSAPRFTCSKSRRSDVARLLDSLSNNKGSLVEPSRPNIVKVLRMFNLCDISSSRPRPRASAPNGAITDKGPSATIVRPAAPRTSVEPVHVDARAMDDSAGAGAEQLNRVGESREQDGLVDQSAAAGSDQEHAGNGTDQVRNHPSPLLPTKHDDAWSETRLEQKGDGGVEVCIGQAGETPAAAATNPSASPSLTPDQVDLTFAPIPPPPTDPGPATTTSGTSETIAHTGGPDSNDAHHNQHAAHEQNHQTGPGVQGATTTGTEGASTMTGVDGSNALGTRSVMNGECQAGRGVAAGSEAGRSGADVQEVAHVESSKLVQEEVGGAVEEDAQAMSARQSARMVDLSLLLDVILKTTASSAKREFIKCGILSQLQAVIGRNFGREYYVILKKILRVVESLPFTADAIYSTRSAQGTFADVLRSMSQNVADKDIRERASALLRKFPMTAIVDQQLLARVRQAKSQTAARNVRSRPRRFDGSLDQGKGESKPGNKGDVRPMSDKEHGQGGASGGPGLAPLNVNARTGSPKGKGRRGAAGHGGRNSPKSKTRQGPRAPAPGPARLGPPVFCIGNNAGSQNLARNAARPTKFSSTPPSAPSETQLQMAPKIVEGLDVPPRGGGGGDPHFSAEEVSGAIMRPRVLAPLITPWARPELMPRNRTGRTMRPMTYKTGVPPHLPAPGHTTTPATSSAPHLPGTPAAGNGPAEGVVLHANMPNAGPVYPSPPDHEVGSPSHAWPDKSPTHWPHAHAPHVPPHALPTPHPDLIPDAKRRRFDNTDMQPGLVPPSLPSAVISPPSVVYGPNTPTPLPANSPLIDTMAPPAAHPMIHLAQVSASLPNDKRPPPALYHQLDPTVTPPNVTMGTPPERAPPISPLPPLPPEAPPESPPPPPPPPSLVPTPMGLQEIFATGVYGGWFPDRNACADDADGSFSPKYSYSPLSPVPTAAPPSPTPPPPQPLPPPHDPPPHPSAAINPPNFMGFQPHKMLFPSTAQPNHPPVLHPPPSPTPQPTTPTDLTATPVHTSNVVPMDTSDLSEPSQPPPLSNPVPHPLPTPAPTAPLYITANPMQSLPPPLITGSYPPQSIPPSLLSRAPLHLDPMRRSLPNGLPHMPTMAPMRSLSVHSEPNLYRPDHHIGGIAPIDPASIPSPEMSAVTEDEQYEASAAAQAADGEVTSTPHQHTSASPAPHVLTSVVHRLNTPMDVSQPVSHPTSLPMSHPMDMDLDVGPPPVSGPAPGLPGELMQGGLLGERIQGGVMASISGSVGHVPLHLPRPETGGGPPGHPAMQNGHAYIVRHELSPSPFSPPPRPTTSSHPSLTSPGISPLPTAPHHSTLPIRPSPYSTSTHNPSVHNDSFPHPSPTFPPANTPVPTLQREPLHISRPGSTWNHHPPRSEFSPSPQYTRPTNPDLTSNLWQPTPYPSSPPARDSAPSPLPQWQGPQPGGSHSNPHDHLTPSKTPSHINVPGPSLDPHQQGPLDLKPSGVAGNPAARQQGDAPNGVHSAMHTGSGGPVAVDGPATGLAAYPNSWKDPSPEFEAFVTDTVRHRIGKYTQPDHPSRITKDDAASLFRKIRKEVIEKERHAWQERSRQNIFKPIERAKLEANIKEFVRVYVRRLHTHK